MQTIPLSTPSRSTCQEIRRKNPAGFPASRRCPLLYRTCPKCLRSTTDPDSVSVHKDTAATLPT